MLEGSEPVFLVDEIYPVVARPVLIQPFIADMSQIPDIMVCTWHTAGELFYG